MAPVPRLRATAAVPTTSYAGCVLSLLATIRVLAAARMRHLRLAGAPVAQAEEAAAKANTLPMGVSASFFFLLAELVGAHGLFTPGTPAKPASIVSFALDAQKGWAMCTEALTSRLSKNKANGKLVSLASCLAQEIFGEQEKMLTAHCLIMVCLLSALLVMLGHRSLMAKDTWKRTIGFVISIFVTIAVFCVLHGPLLAKFWHKLVLAKLIEPLQILLRAIACILAETPREDGEGTPPLWTVLQVGSLMAVLIKGVTTSTFVKEAANLKEGFTFDLLYDSSMASYVGPCLLSMLWLSFVHLRKQPAWLVLTAFVCMAMAPSVVANGGNFLAVQLQLKPETVLGAIEQALSIVYCATALLSLLSGGALNLMCVLILLQVMLHIHGIETFLVTATGQTTS